MNTKISSRLTIITFTHFWKNAPSTELIERTFDSIYSNMDIKGCEHIINYDMKEESVESKEYLNNLINLKNKYNPNIKVTTHGTTDTRRSYIYSGLVKRAKTPYIMLWEHDFILKKKVDLERILDALDNNNNINFIRFNKRKTEPQGRIDKWMEPETNIKDIPLVRFCGYTGNPHIERKNWFIKYCKPLILSIPVKKKNSIERAMNIDIMKRRDEYGIEDTHKFLGSFIYGDIGEDKYVESLEEFKSREAWGDKEPNKEWKERNKDV